MYLKTVVFLLFISILDILQKSPQFSELLVPGWVHPFRVPVMFLVLGHSLKLNLQILYKRGHLSILKSLSQACQSEHISVWKLETISEIIYTRYSRSNT